MISMYNSLIPSYISGLLNIEPSNIHTDKRGLSYNERILTANAREGYNLEINILTAEGDRVTLSASSLEELSYTSYNRTGLLNGVKASTNIEGLLFSKESMVELTIQGDLNEEELSDITKALKRIEGLIHGFIRGEGESAFADMGSKMDSLQVIDLSYTYTQSISIEGSSKDIYAPSNGTGSGDVDKKELKGRDRVADKILKIIDDTKIAPHKRAKVFHRLIDEIFKKILSYDELDKEGHERGKALKSRLHKGLSDL